VKRITAAGLVSLGSLAAGGAHAYTLGGVSINGFGQVVAGTTLDNNKQYPTNQNPEYSYDADLKFNEESLFALQFSAPLTSKLTATAQVVAHGNDDFKTEFEWAYVNYQFDSDWSVKAGRQRAPFFYYSDYLEVSVAYPWLRVPTSVYSSVANFSNFDGVSINYSHAYGSWQLDPQIIYGRYTGTIALAPDNAGQANIDIKNFVGASLHASYNDWLNLRAGYFTSNTTITGTPVDQVTQLLDASGYTKSAGDLEINGDRFSFFELGSEIDYAKWQVIGEFIGLKSSTGYVAHSYDSYIAFGRHLGKFLPMFTYGRVNASTPSTAINDLPPGATFPAGTVAPVAVPASSVVEPVIASETSHGNYYQFDLRYDLANNVALKANFTDFHNSVPGQTSSKLLSAGIAFSF
jgi:hypothetical protein